MLKQIAVAVAVALGGANLAWAQTSGVGTAGSSSSGPGPVESMPVLGIGTAQHSTDPAAPAMPIAGPAADSAQDRMWFSADYLMGWVRSAGTPALVTTNPSGTSQLTAGALGGSTSILFGHENYGGDYRNGFEIGGGGWFDANRTLGMEAGFFMLGDQNRSFVGSSPSGSPILARPFFNILNGAQGSDLIAYPGLFNGSIAASARSNEFYGANVDLEEVFASSGNFRAEGLIGYRYLRFNDALSVATNSTAVGGGLEAAGTQTQTADRFTAENSYNGGDVGLRLEYFDDRWSVAMTAKIGAGNINRSVGIEGTTTVSAPGQTPAVNNGGILALSSNSGVFHSEDWVVLPEAGLQIGYALTSNIHLRLGYSFLYLPDAARAGNQVNTNINTNLFPPVIAGGPTTPTFTLQKSDIWVQTVNVGLEFRF